MKLTNVANVAVIGALAPVVIALLSSRLLHERIARRDAVLAGCAFLGVVTVAVGSYRRAVAGAGWATCSRS